MPAALRYSAACRRSRSPEAFEAAKAGGVFGIVAMLVTLVLLAV